MNKKGMTLLEVLVSVALAATLMVFMYNLITDVSEEKKIINTYNDNLLKVSEIEIEAQKILNKVEGKSAKEKKIVTLDKVSTTADSLIFELSNGESYSMKFAKESGKNIFSITLNGKKWTFDGLSCSTDSIEIVNKDNKMIIIKIPLKTNTKEVSHVIEIPYYSNEYIDINLS